MDDDSVKLIRKGDINMNLHFVEGQTTTTFYDISAGRIPLEVKTLRILHFVSGDGGKLKIHYELYQDNEKMGSYQYEINYGDRRMNIIDQVKQTLVEEIAASINKSRISR